MRYSICVLSCILIFFYFDICTSAGWRRWRRLWRGWVAIPTGIGVSLFTVLQWRRLSSEPKQKNPAKNFQIACYRAIPFRAMSRAWGWLSSQHVPLSIRYWLYTSYAKMYGVNLEEAAHSLEQYSSLCEFFIRPLKEGVRPIAEFESLVSPADGSAVNVGLVNSCNVEQIKGVTYTIKTFLGDLTWNENRIIKPISNSDSYGGNRGITSTAQNTSLHDTIVKMTAAPRITSKFAKYKTDSVINRLEKEGCDLLHLDLNKPYSCGNNKISANFSYDSRMLGWLVFYFQFCIKGLLVNSFYFGFQIIYGIKSSIELSNGKISKGASFLRSQFSYSSGSYSSSESPIFRTRIDATTDSLGYNTDSDDESDDEEKCYDPDWSEYKKRLLHNQENELYQFVVYLAPGDYHRFHSPADLKIKFRRHFQGELLSVNPKIAKWIPELFSLNERAVYVGEWHHGFFSFVAVGATNVGSIKVHNDEELLTNTRKWENGVRFKDKVLNTDWKKGEEIGEFRLGSTIVLLFEAPKDFSFCVKPGQRIRVGEPVTALKTECAASVS